ncbi:hypothetical protein JR316_0006451 [Psilocybe cubensis]|uniref:Uncharacterized protein n=1 Tax=Psilocybe cubensis TaxID=181762 RepID=A0ACB8H257_PSICU|nr:hypothetical protein JR316_0006451 [Psilocybe cubensis]KAH9481921.1 hypothetical protein JR316_0006451 [Psilocybe cubensis]
MAKSKFFSKIVTNASRTSSMLWLGGEVVCDICIAVCMFHLLRRAKVEKTGSTRNHAQRIIKLTVETGGMTATVALLDVLLILIHRGAKYDYQPTTAAVSKLYSNTLLLSLNSRVNPSPQPLLLGPRSYSTPVSFCETSCHHTTTDNLFGSRSANTNSTLQSRR